MTELNNLKFEKADGVARITLNRPKFNMMNIEMMNELNSLFEDLLKDDDLKCVAINAEGKHFCTGVEVADHKPDQVDDMIATFNRIFELHPDPSSSSGGSGTEYENYLVNMLGGTLEEIPRVYDLLSPITHVSKESPPTLILQGSDDVFDLAPPVRCLHQALQEAGVPVVLVEYPHTEHGFDLILPQISPVAQAATREVERFLAHMV